MEITFGTKKVTQLLDENGSTKSVEVDYSNSTKDRFRVHYKIRTRVTSAEEERKEYEQFSKMVEYNPNFLDPVFSIETSIAGKKHGYYYAVRSYCRLIDSQEHPEMLALIQQI